MRFSVITPVYNRADCVARCIESVVRNLQWGIEIEHVIVDDGSKDDTASIVSSYAAKYPHIHFIKFEKNRGTNAARNAAIAAAKADWCIILDSDDYFLDTALRDIEATMKELLSYRHYMFAPDDMQGEYEKNSLLHGEKHKELTYLDFLSGRVGGDFIHVCNTAILRKYPFREEIRIQEGIFFLQFFREAQRMLFTNIVVTIRERSREDSVTRETIRTNDTIIKRCIMGTTLQLQYFANDYQRYGLTHILRSLQVSLLDNLLLLGRYDEAKSLLTQMGASASKKESLLKLIASCHCGWAYKLALRFFLWTKYHILHTTIK